MVKSTTKTGRPTAVYRTTWGEQIIGLMRLKDGRWRISGPEKKTYSERDERLAIARFHELTAKDEKVLIPLVNAKPGPFDYQPPEGWKPPATQVDETAAWLWFREQLLTRPQYVAQRVGIEQIGYLANLKRPTESPTLKAIGELYAAKPGLSPHEASTSKLYWREFARATGAKTLREIDHEAVGRFETATMNRNLSAKSVHHRYIKVRTIIRYAMKRGRGAQDCRAALDVLEMLEVSKPNSLDPRPITRDQFWAAYHKAEKAGDDMATAILLLSLNCAMYSGEVAEAAWDDIDIDRGYLVTRRPKNQISRIAVLWPETIQAIKKLPRRGDRIFYTRVQPHTSDSVMGMWRKYRTNKSIKFSQLRDAAYSIAVEKTTFEQAELLAGHRLPGVADHYLRRRPDLVKGACEAIREAFIRR